jgi:hypothetical protein
MSEVPALLNVRTHKPGLMGHLDGHHDTQKGDKTNRELPLKGYNKLQWQDEAVRGEKYAHHPQLPHAVSNSTCHLLHFRCSLLAALCISHTDAGMGELPLTNAVAYTWHVCYSHCLLPRFWKLQSICACMNQATHTSWEESIVLAQLLF